MLAEQQPNQRMQEEPMSTTQQLMLPNDAANYDAPQGGFSADPKVALLAQLRACCCWRAASAALVVKTGTRFGVACKAACKSLLLVLSS